MKFTGIITAVSAIASGTSKSSGKAWRKIEACLTYDNSKPEYPKAIVFSVLNDNIEKFALRIGGEYEVEIDFAVHEYNNRNYLSASCWKAEPKAATPPQPQVQEQPQEQPAAAQDNDLPF